MNKSGDYLHDDFIRVNSGPDCLPMVTGCLATFAVGGHNKELVKVVCSSSREAL